MTGSGAVTALCRQREPMTCAFSLYLARALAGTAQADLRGPGNPW